MSIGRRQVLLQGGVFGAGIIASNMSGMEALAQGAPPERLSLEGLSETDPIIQTYRDAVGIMKNKPASDPFSWVSLAQIHGTNPNAYHFCPHGDWYFLPWHRAYTAMYEKAVRQLTSNPGFAMPYWDWTTNPLMPEVFLSPKTAAGKPNWLCVLPSEDQGPRTWDPSQPMPLENVGPDVLTQILNATDYEQFGTSRNPQQTDLDPSWVPAGNGNQGVLEGNAHNNVHNDIGGWMPSASSPRDPIFFMHHSNIDRIWAVWNLSNQNSADPLWTDMPFTNNFLNPDGTSWSPKVSDLYVPETLGYTYGLGSMAVASNTTGNVAALNTKMTSLFVLPKAATTKPAGIVTASAANTATATAGHALDLAVTVPNEQLAAIAKRKRLGAGAAMMNFAAAREFSAAGTRAIAFIREVGVTGGKSTMFRIFIDKDNLTAATPISDPHYVGTFSVLEHPPHGGHKAPPSFAVDLTAAIARVYGAGKVPTGKLRVQLLPVPSPGSKAPVGTAKPARVEITFVSV